MDTGRRMTVQGPARGPRGISWRRAVGRERSRLIVLMPCAWLISLPVSAGPLGRRGNATWLADVQLVFSHPQVRNALCATVSGQNDRLPSGAAAVARIGGLRIAMAHSIYALPGIHTGDCPEGFPD